MRWVDVTIWLVFLGRPERLSRTRRSPIGLRRQGFFSVEGSLGGADRRRKYYAYYEPNACEPEPADRNRAWHSESAEDRRGGGRHGTSSLSAEGRLSTSSRAFGRGLPRVAETRGPRGAR